VPLAREIFNPLDSGLRRNDSLLSNGLSGFIEAVIRFGAPRTEIIRFLQQPLRTHERKPLILLYSNVQPAVIFPAHELLRLYIRKF
jgi:hypothetical protein